ncbi:Uncharacterized protein DAT39_004307 [Clarias magur]|uniref:Uncharacterized protein n=1 Tax=Clarias magur TaxID=1594786 RepID=A0A8J4UTU3_CLAMG|nr:Uncharacterized protein DAT39_004307 [Clarias magur]
MEELKKSTAVNFSAGRLVKRFRTRGPDLYEIKSLPLAPEKVPPENVGQTCWSFGSRDRCIFAKTLSIVVDFVQPSSSHRW